MTRTDPVDEHRDTGDPAPVEREVPSDTPTGVDLEKVIAKRVRALRRSTGLSVGDMAVKVGISKAMLSKIENAQTSCSLNTLARLAAGLDVPVEPRRRSLFVVDCRTPLEGKVGLTIDPTGVFFRPEGKFYLQLLLN